MNVSIYTEIRPKLTVAIATALLITFAAVPASAADADQSRTDQPQSEASENLQSEADKEPQKLEALEEMIVTTGSRLQQAADQVDLGARHYFDLAAIWNYNEYTSLRVGVNNLFDKAPPLAGNAAGPSFAGNGNTFPGLYDGLGRYWFVGVSVGLS